ASRGTPDGTAAAGDPGGGRQGVGQGRGRSARRDEHDHGLGDLPYPPEYPKMPGEPKRVQPSRARRNGTPPT
ncbi:hypothetical protein ACWDAZ_41245, partial [Streptomyces sp. NPDC001215]